MPESLKIAQTFVCSYMTIVLIMMTFLLYLVICVKVSFHFLDKYTANVKFAQISRRAINHFDRCCGNRSLSQTTRR